MVERREHHVVGPAHVVPVEVPGDDPCVAAVLAERRLRNVRHVRQVQKGAVQAGVERLEGDGVQAVTPAHVQEAALLRHVDQRLDSVHRRCDGPAESGLGHGLQPVLPVDLAGFGDPGAVDDDAGEPGPVVRAPEHVGQHGALVPGGRRVEVERGLLCVPVPSVGALQHARLRQAGAEHPRHHGVPSHSGSEFLRVDGFAGVGEQFQVHGRPDNREPAQPVHVPVNAFEQRSGRHLRRRRYHGRVPHIIASSLRFSGTTMGIPRCVMISDSIPYTSRISSGVIISGPP